MGQSRRPVGGEIVADRVVRAARAVGVDLRLIAEPDRDRTALDPLAVAFEIDPPQALGDLAVGAVRQERLTGIDMHDRRHTAVRGGVALGVHVDLAFLANPPWNSCRQTLRPRARQSGNSPLM